jgi:hypothetical protein
MSLAEQLDKIRAGGAKRLPEDTRAVMAAATKGLRDSDLLDRALNTGDRLPAFALENAQGTVVRSDALLAKGPMVVTVFRGVW